VIRPGRGAIAALLLVMWGPACETTGSPVPDAPDATAADDPDGASDADASDADASDADAPQATVFDLGAAFSGARNPNGPWRYGYSRIRSLASGDFALDTLAVTSGPVPFWHPREGADGYYPYVAGNAGNATLVDATGSWAVRPREVAMEGSLAGQYSVVQFAAPWSGKYQVVAAFSGIHVRLSSTDVHILRGEVALFDAEIDGYGGDPSLHPVAGGKPSAGFTATLDLQQNEVLSFAVGYGVNQTHYNDTTGLFLQIRSLP
jgi:hypothetical protein